MAKAASLLCRASFVATVRLFACRCVCVRVSVRKLSAKHFFGCMPLVTMDLRKLVASLQPLLLFCFSALASTALAA